MSLIEPSYALFFVVLIGHLALIAGVLLYVGWELQGGENEAEKAWRKSRWFLLLGNLIALALYITAVYKLFLSGEYVNNILLVLYMFFIFSTIFYSLKWIISKMRENRESHQNQDEQQLSSEKKHV